MTAMGEKMDSYQEMKANQARPEAKMDSHHEELKMIMKGGQEKIKAMMEDGLEKTEATDSGANPE
jgi:hypothetical protein